MGSAPSRALAREVERCGFRAIGAPLAHDVYHIGKFMGSAPSRALARYAVAGVLRALGIRARGHLVFTP